MLNFHKKNIDSELDYILDAIHDDILISDAMGVIIRLSKSFEAMYGVKREDIIGRTVYELEEEGIFKPSITAIVLKTGQKTTMRQKNNIGRDIVVSAVPIKDENGQIINVISFSRDITEYLSLQEQYRELETKIEKFTAEISELRDRVYTEKEIIAESTDMKKVINLALKVAKYDTNVLITGESGVGKTLLARYIHSNSSRSEEAFVEINCGAIPESLIESELFGYEPGSFTGANKQGKMGLIEIANKGTLFLDEISELSLNLQVKLLKVIQDKVFVKVGGTKEVYVDFCLITATNKNLQDELENHLFREDLFYRINVINIHIPPIRQREKDMIELIRYKMKYFNDKYCEKKYLSPTVYNHLLSYKWPGNIRELENIIERIIITAESEEIREDSLPICILNSNDDLQIQESVILADTLKMCEKQQILKAYNKHNTTTGVAKELGISQPTAYRKIKEYVLDQ